MNFFVTISKLFDSEIIATKNRTGEVVSIDPEVFYDTIVEVGMVFECCYNRDDKIIVLNIPGFISF